LLAIVDDAPVVFPGHWVEISLAQETLVVALDELVDRSGEPAVFGLIDLDGADVLLPAVDGFDLLIAAQVFCHFGRRYGQREKNQQDHEENAEQEKAVFLLEPGL
jgi:hypothetical protein